MDCRTGGEDKTMGVGLYNEQDRVYLLESRTIWFMR